MSTTNRFGPVQPDNTPARRRRRPDPDEQDTPTPGETTPPETPPPAPTPDPPATTGPAPNQGRRGNPPAAPPRTTSSINQLSVGDVLHGAPDPSEAYHQTGVRLPRYVYDAVRARAVFSRGELTHQAIITAAVIAYLDPGLLDKSWIAHGGREGERPR